MVIDPYNIDIQMKQKEDIYDDFKWKKFQL